jgi:hypothetical protein
VEHFLPSPFLHLIPSLVAQRASAHAPIQEESEEVDQDVGVGNGIVRLGWHQHFLDNYPRSA